MSGTLGGIKWLVMNQTDKAPCHVSAYIPMRTLTSKYINKLRELSVVFSVLQIIKITIGNVACDHFDWL